MKNTFTYIFIFQIKDYDQGSEKRKFSYFDFMQERFLSGMGIG